MSRTRALPVRRPIPAKRAPATPPAAHAEAEQQDETGCERAHGHEQPLLRELALELDLGGRKRVPLRVAWTAQRPARDLEVAGGSPRVDEPVTIAAVSVRRQHQVEDCGRHGLLVRL